MKEIKREKIQPLHVNKGDTLELWYSEDATYSNGKVERISDTMVLGCKIKKNMVVDEAVAFYVEKGDFKGAVDGIGGAFLTTVKL